MLNFPPKDVSSQHTLYRLAGIYIIRERYIIIFNILDKIKK